MPARRKDIDAELLAAIETYDGVPTVPGLANIINAVASTIRLRLSENRDLTESMERRGMEWLDLLGEKEFLGKFSDTGWVSSLPKYASERINERFSRLTLREIKASEKVPTVTSLADALGVSGHSVIARLPESPALMQAMEKRGKECLANMGEREFLLKCSDLGWIGNLPDYARRAAEERFSEIILRWILAFDGVPLATTIAHIQGVNPKTVQVRIDNSPALREAMENRGKEYLNDLSEKDFMGKFSNASWVAHLPGHARKTVYARFSAIVLKAIERFDGIPTAGGLSKVMGVSSLSISARIRAEPVIMQAMEKRGKEYLTNLNEREFLNKYSGHGWISSVPDYAKKLAKERFLGIILINLRESNGVPNPTSIAEVVGVARLTIQARIDECPALMQAMEKRGKEYLANMGEREFLLKFSELGWVVALPDYARRVAEERFSEIILRNISAFNGVPNSSSLARTVCVAGTTLQARIPESPALMEAMEKRGKDYLSSLGEREILIKFSESGWLANLPDYARKLVEERFSEILLRTIQDSDSSLTVSALSRTTGVSEGAIHARISVDPSLWVAFYQKRGLTPDQAIELAIERDDDSKAAAAVLERRLQHLHSFREMAGIIMCFGSQLGGRVLEVSLYPEPLSKAAAELSVQLDVLHVPMRSFRRNEPPELQAANAAVLQGIHRLATEGLTSLFSKVHESLGKGNSVIATFSTQYAHCDAFLNALLENGFMLQESGILRIEPPANAILRSYGVGEDDLAQVRNKIKCESGVLVMTISDPGAVIPIPQLEKMPSAQGETVLSPTTKEIDSPPGIVKEISARFLQDTVVLPSAPFIVDVLHEEKLVAVLGYDMDPSRKNSIESAVYPHAPAMDFRRLARTLATRAAERMRLGIKPNRVSKVPLERLR